MKVEDTKNTSRSMYLRGYRAAVVWNDKSRSYYKTRKQAISAMRSEQAKKPRKRRK